MDRIAAAIKLHALKLAGQKASRPLPGRDRLRIPSSDAGHHDKPGQIRLSLPKP